MMVLVITDNRVKDRDACEENDKFLRPFSGSSKLKCSLRLIQSKICASCSCCNQTIHC